MERVQNISIDPSIFSAIRGKAARLMGVCGFSTADRADLQQELVFDCFSRLRKFDPTKSSCRTFLHRVVGHRVATLVSAQRAARRDYRLCRDSLDAPTPVTANDSIELGETVSGDAYEARMGRSERPSCERSELRIDVDSVISRLPAELAAVAVLLKRESAVEVGRRMGISRATTYRRLAQIREVFTAAGLDGYLRRRQAVSRAHYKTTH
jgi:RNA polymerase sigma factor (sigma-70 family)